MMEKVRAGVVGVGHMGRYHVGVYSELFNVELAGVVDQDLQRAREVAGQYGTTAYRDAADLIGRVDVVSIAVPTLQHYDVARQFLEAGVHVLLEKPITNTLQEAQELFRIAQERGVVLHVGHVERFNGAVQELKKIVANPIFIECHRLGPFEPRIRDDGVVLDLMIHDIDIVLNLVGSPVASMHVVGSSVMGRREDLANVQMKFANGCLASITASRVTQNKVRAMAITQPDAYIFLNFTDQDIRVYRQASSEHVLSRTELRYKQESLIERIFVHRDNPLKSEIKHLLDCATNSAPRAVSVDEELYSLQIALDILAQLARDR